MKKAAIDIGTNSVRLLLADLEDGRLTNRSKRLVMTRLGKGMKLERRLSDQSIRETLEALADYVNVATHNGYSLVRTIATSAVRDAINAADLLAPAKEQLGMTIEVIDGTEEALLGYIGAAGGFLESDEPRLIIDIGGGSTELIIGSGQDLEHTVSINMGAVRMTESFEDLTQPGTLKMTELIQTVHLLLGDSGVGPLPQKIRAIGIGGTITTLGAMDMSMAIYDAERIQGHSLTLQHIEALIARIASTSPEDRKTMVGLEPKRSDIILAGAVILREIMVHFRLQEVVVSDYDNLEGILIVDAGI